MPACWLFCQPAGVSAGLCLPAGFSASLPAFLPVFACLLAFLPACRRFCRSLPACWPFCQPAGVSAGLCLPAGLFACLSAFLPALPACWLLCQSAGVSAGLCLPAGFCVFLLVFVLCSICFGLPGDSRMPFFLSPSAWSFAFRWLHCFRASICAASTFYAFMFLVAQFLISVVHVDILLINACARAFSFLSFTY
ncbi:hypothetical protein, partial [Thiolapillus sp.]|uniref:hypothetical protein n=1 Tax=Thiolapillus sp. TaxID=2017437 RepID=UPI003AF80D85